VPLRRCKAAICDSGRHQNSAHQFCGIGSPIASAEIEGLTTDRIVREILDQTQHRDDPPDAQKPF